METKMQGVETEWREAWWRHWGWETSFAGPGGNSANPEAQRSFLRESWRLCTPSLWGQGPKTFGNDNSYQGILIYLKFINTISMSTQLKSFIDMVISFFTYKSRRPFYRDPNIQNKQSSVRKMRISSYLQMQV